MSGTLEDGLSRRALLTRAAAGALAAGGITGAARALVQAGEAMAAVPGSELLPTPDAIRATLEALADTFVPGPAGGADDEPGAVEAGVVDELYLPFYGVTPVFPVVHEDIQLATKAIVGSHARFDLSLPYADRERILDQRINQPSEGGPNPAAIAFQAIGILTYLTYYGTAQSQVGPKVIGFPPRSDGYFPHHSYGVRFKGMTRRGHPS